ncbi:PLP-dependent aminotransferase family protein [Nonomuraea sp. NPDC059023]|uniref:aminotransferase-like domain-containing protein n=1 Tax=unclassified Nonomuraea TaxID=2593643 RepID=UPI0036CA2762
MVEALTASGAQAVVLTPAHQWPTGVVLAPERRHQLLAWGGLIIEDDYDAEFRYDRQPVGALQGLAADRVFLLGTVSKTLAPVLRLGWVICPPGWAGRVAGQKALLDRGSPALDQVALAILIELGRFDRHLRQMRGIYAHRPAALVAAVGRHAPQIRLTGLDAGFHAIAHLPAGAKEESLVAAARERGVGLYGMSGNVLGAATSGPCLVMGFGNVREQAIDQGVAALADLLR